MEYYCYNCGQLRLFAFPKDQKPTECGNCGSNQIEIGEIGSEKLSGLRGIIATSIFMDESNLSEGS